MFINQSVNLIFACELNLMVQPSVTRLNLEEFIMAVAGTFKDRCEKMGVSYTMALQRYVYWGYTLDEAVNKPKRTQKDLVKDRRKYFYKGRPALDVAVENGITKRAFFARVITYGWSVQQACTIPLMRRKHPDLQEIRKISVSDYNTILCRINRGWSKEDALRVPIDRGYRNRKRDFRFWENKNARKYIPEFNGGEK